MPIAFRVLLEAFVRRSTAVQGVVLGRLEPGTTIVVTTHNSRYRVVTLPQPSVVRVQGGAMFVEETVARFEGAADGGSALKTGCILVGFQMELCVGILRIRSSRVQSISIETHPRLPSAHAPSFLIE